MSIGLATFGDCDPCCGDECLICSDDFNRADSDDVSTGSDCGWTETAGNPTIESNALKFTGTSSILLCDTPHPDGEPDVSVQVRVKSSATGNLARIILAYTDASNYHFAEWKAGTGGYLRIYQRASGSNTQLVTTTANTSLDTWYTFAACATGKAIAATLLGVDFTQFWEVGTNDVNTGDSFGLGTGGVLSGSILYDDFEVRLVSPACAKCRIPCQWCEEDDDGLTTTPQYFQVVLQGLIPMTVPPAPPGTVGCVDCPDLNGTYICDQYAACNYEYLISPAICGYNRLLVIINSAGFLCRLIHSTSTTFDIEWLGGSAASPRDCRVEDLSLTATNAAKGRCFHSGTDACVITAL